MSLQTPESNLDNNVGTHLAESLKLWSCINCRRRKVRCDRRHPCAPCSRNKTDCVFPVSGRIPRRSRDSKYSRNSTQKQTELLGRLRRLEAMVGDLGSQVEHAAAVSEGHHPLESSVGATNAMSAASDEIVWPDHGFARHSQIAYSNPPTALDEVQTGSSGTKDTSESPQVSDQSRGLVVTNNGEIVVDDRFWTLFCKEVEQIFEAVHEPTSVHLHTDSRLTTMPTSDNRRHSGFHNFLLRNTSATQPREAPHPLPSQMLFLWQIYMDNIDPFMKLLHVPTVTKVIREIRGSYESLNPSMQALVLAIAFATIMSLEGEEVHTNFNTGKDQLLARYRVGTEQALEQADFLNDPDTIVLQALAIYLGVLQYTGEARFAWSLTGVLVRLAVSMKLQRDGSNLTNISPFETEMRRRLWWQICLIDSRSEDLQVSAYKIGEEMFDTQMPANTDDVNLNPGMPASPIVVESWTGMTVFLIRCEIWKLSRRLQSVTVVTSVLPDTGKRLELFQQCQATIENTYLKHLDPNQPIHAFVTAMTRLFLTKVSLILNFKHQSARATQPHHDDSSQSDKLFMSSLLIIEYTYALQNEPSWSDWRWQMQGRQPPWHALHAVLTQLCTRSWDSICDRAWSSAMGTFNSLSEAVHRDSQYRQLSVLVSAVQRKRKDELRHQNSAASTITAGALPSPKTLTSSASRTHIDTSGTLSTWMPQNLPQNPFLGMVDDTDDNTLGDDLDLDMEWRAWDDIAGDIQPSFGSWDMGGL